MSRTYRRRGERREYRWVLRDRSDATPWWAHALLDSRSKEGRRAIARFHSDAEVTMRSGVPHWFCRIFKRRQRNADTRELLVHPLRAGLALRFRERCALRGPSLAITTSGSTRTADSGSRQAGQTFQGLTSLTPQPS